VKNVHHIIVVITRLFFPQLNPSDTNQLLISLIKQYIRFRLWDEECDDNDTKHVLVNEKSITHVNIRIIVYQPMYSVYRLKNKTCCK
jgi:hypothetical protein